MRRMIFLWVGIFGTASGIVLLLCGLLWIVINDAEWGHIAETGLPSHPDAMTWSKWNVDDGSVHPFIGYQPLEHPKTLTEYRIARGHALLFDYTFYQGRYEQDGMVKEFPALGPESGTSYRPIWAILAFLIGTGAFIIRARFPKNYAQIPPNIEPLSP